MQTDANQVHFRILLLSDCFSADDLQLREECGGNMHSVPDRQGAPQLQRQGLQALAREAILCCREFHFSHAKFRNRMMKTCLARKDD